MIALLKCFEHRAFKDKSMPFIRTAQADPDLINFAGTASLFVNGDAEPLTVKITWVIVREDGD